MVPPPPPALPSFWIGTWARPPDRPSQVALGLAAVLLVAAFVPGGPRWLASVLDVTGITEPRRTRRFLFVTAFVAAFLSLGYIAFYLRGGPRAADAAAYWVQARALSHGHLAWSAPDPSASFRAKNLLITAPATIAGVFAPGYALLLGATFLLGAPMLIGPLLAAALIPATWLLARELAEAAEDAAPSPGAPAPRARALRIEWTGRIAAGLSLVSAALRYHTAESLPHGAAAAALTVALASALRARRTSEPRLFAVAGLALGFLVATEPASAIGVGAVVLVLAIRSGACRRAVPWMFAAALPGVALWLAANHAAVGHALGSPAAFYAARFGPAHEGGGFKAGAVGVLRRLRTNLADVANFEPLALLPLLLLRPSVRPRVGRASLAAAAVFVLTVAFACRAGDAQAAESAGAFASVLPVQHALIALTLALSFPGATRGVHGPSLGHAVTATLALAVAGFALHVAHDHERLAAEGLGRPHYEPDVAREAGVTHGLLFFDDDEGFELAHDPGVLASHGVEAVRWRGDDHDRLLYDLLGHPQTHRYMSGHAPPTVSGWAPNGGDVWRFEAEADFPPVVAPAPAAGHATIVDATGTCASDGRALALEPTAAEASLAIELPAPRGAAPDRPRTWMVAPRVYQRGGPGAGEVVVLDALGGHPLAQWSWTDAGAGPTCSELPARAIELGGDRPRAWLVLTARGGSVALDKTTLRGR